MDLNTAALQAFDTAINTAFNTSLTGTTSTYAMVAMTVPSTTAANVYPKLSDIPGMRKWVGERHVHRLSQDGFTIVNDKFENTIAVDVDKLADDQYGMYSMLASEFGQAAAELPDELVWDQLEKGFDTEHYDGQFFFDTDHPVEDENGNPVSVSNFGGGSGSAWYLIDDTRFIRPMIFQDRLAPQITAMTNLTDPNVFSLDELQWGVKRRCAVGFGAWQLIYASRQPLTEANYEAARKAMLEMRGHRGRKLNIRPRKLIVSAANEGPARKLLMAENNAAGATNVWRNTAELHVETRLTI
jgi:phage major head subunit gpT-like protein